MASKGKYVSGTDGTDFIHRERVVFAHSFSATSKSYIRKTFYLHFLLCMAIVPKLTEDILDRMDIFILELQELQIPKPDLWEWLYVSSFIFTLFAARAIRTNSASMMKLYLLGIMIFALGSIIMAQFQYFMDFWLFIHERNIKKLTHVWRGLPLAVIFEAFAIIALQVHLFQLYYSYKLYKIWQPYGARRKQPTINSSSTTNNVEQNTSNASSSINKKLN